VAAYRCADPRFCTSAPTVRGEVRRSDAGLRTGRLCAQGSRSEAVRPATVLLEDKQLRKQIRIELVVVRLTRATGNACLVVSGWAGRLGGPGRRGCAGKALRLLDELTEPVDGVLVGAKVVAVQGLLGASVLFGLLLEDPRQGG
jgi:hypothetical protein